MKRMCPTAAVAQARADRALGACTAPLAARTSIASPGVLDGALAFAAMTANGALNGQVRGAHALGRLNRAGSEAIDATKPLLPEGPLRDTVALAARMQGQVADAIFETANHWGRAFGRLAFAFPVGARHW